MGPAGEAQQSLLTLESLIWGTYPENWDSQTAAFTVCFIMEKAVLVLRAKNSAAGVDRVYEIRVGSDLFGVWVVERSWGSAGCFGRVRREVFAELKHALDCALTHLKRRRGGKKRFGAEYTVQRSDYY